VQTVTAFLDPTYLINTCGMVGIMAILFAECGRLVGFFLPGDSLLFTTGLLVAGRLIASLGSVLSRRSATAARLIEGRWAPCGCCWWRTR
jgi:membrane protein DedA with SNARE-associated domain